ncbi:MAG: glycosyltransferase, partial [Planctomycetota bacterium]
VPLFIRGKGCSYRLRNWRVVANELTALAERRGDIEVIAIEFGSTKYAEGYNFITRVQCEGEFSRSRACNQALQAMKSDMVCYCDSDMIMSPGQWDKAIAEAEHFDACSPYSRFQKLGPDKTCNRILNENRWVRDGNQWNWNKPIDTKAGGSVKFYDANLAGGIFICTAEFIGSTGWDERFQEWGHEDAALEIVAKEGDYKIGKIDGNAAHLYHKTYARVGLRQTQPIWDQFYRDRAEAVQKGLTSISRPTATNPAATKRVLLFEVSGGHKKWWAPIKRHFDQLGYAIDYARKHIPANLSKFDQIVIWNGEQSQDKELAKRATDAGVPFCYLEVGYFSQQDHCMITPRGSVGGALLSDVDSLDPITDEEEALVQVFFEKYANGQTTTDGGYVLVPLQLSQDYSIRNYSPFKTMQQLAEAVESKYPEDQIVYRPHPKMRDGRVRTKHVVELTPSIWQQVLRAKEVVGINSTLLYEAALAGKKVTALGDCPLKRFPGQHREVVREIIRRQVPLNCNDLTPYLLRMHG